ncbi:hypothetical protein BDV18DRAFT_145579 [Aspergillus unguis]
MANVSPPRRALQPPTVAPKASDRLAVPDYHIVDPLLGNLSPESTLQALSSADAVPTNEQAAHDILSKSILQASPSERALGIRAAVAAQKLGKWHREVHKWDWPKRTDAQLGKGFIPPSDAEDSIYYGSLPAAVVKEHEDRIEEIREGMDNLDVEELKEHVLNAHIPGRSRPSSANSTMSVPPPLSYVQLSDFTAVISATILRALPLLSRLSALLSSWDVRLLVLRQIPGLLQSLRFARSQLNSASDLLKSSAIPTEKDVLYSMSNYHAKRTSLESTVLSAGRRIDRILDSLDGREDSLPEHWIDDLEAIEADFASWVMLAEKRTVENEWRRLSARASGNTKPQHDPIQSNTEYTQPELLNLDENLFKPAPVHVEIPPTEVDDSEEVAIAPTPVLHSRPSLLQVGRTHPMETIVEEVGSPFGRPISQSAGNIIDSPSKARFAPESPTPLLADGVDTLRNSDPVPMMQLNTDRAVTAENTSQDVEAVESILHFPAEIPRVEQLAELAGSDSDSSNISSAETPANSDEPQVGVDVNDSSLQSLVAALPVEEPLASSKILNDERSTPMEAEPIVLDEPAKDVGVEQGTLQPVVNPVEKPLHLDEVLANGSPADLQPRSPPSSHNEDSLPPMAVQDEQITSKVLQLAENANATSTDLPTIESTHAELVSQDIDSPVQLPLEERQSTAEASLATTDATTSSPVAESVQTDLVPKKILTPVPSSPKEHQSQPQASPGDPDITSTRLPIAESSQAQPALEEIHSPVELPVGEHHPQAQDSLLGVDTVPANLSNADLMQAESLPQETDHSVALSPEEHLPQPQTSPCETDIKTQVSSTPLANELTISHNVALPALDDTRKPVAELEPISIVDTAVKASKNHTDSALQVDSLLPISKDEPRPSIEADENSQVMPAVTDRVTQNDAVPKDMLSESNAPEFIERSAPERCVTPPPGDNVASLPNLFVPHEKNKAPERSNSEDSEQDDKNAPKKPLDSPIKLSRPGRLELDKQKSKSRVRRTSNGSDGSLSDYPSLVSSQEPPEPRTSSSNGTPLLLETPPHFPKDYRPTARNDHTLREDRLLHLDAQKPSPRDLAHNRTLSLPLQRFINESFDVNYETSGSEDVFSAKLAAHRKAPAERRQKSESSTLPKDIGRSKVQRPELVREMSSGPDSDVPNDRLPKVQSRKEKMMPSRYSPKTSAPAEPPSNMATARLKQRLTAHPSLESIGSFKSEAQAGHSKVLRGKTKSRSSSLSKQMLRPKDHLDEKINTILTSLPGQIHLVPADQDDDAISIASTVPYRRERLRSDSPQGTPSRSFTPTPSLTLRPAMGRRRHSHAPEESSVKLYHLHRGGKSAPTKLFVRTVGENGERVMVRVGGGWADLAEYLREYAIHHGRRHVSETPRVEVEGLTPRESPSYSPPSSRVPSGSSRQMPARPGSVLSNRPASSLAVRKTRRSSNVSDLGDHRIASAGDALNVSFSPMPGTLSDRRLSVSSNVSAGAMSSVSELRHGSPGAPTIPLGLAGPKPRAKHATISPESEAWVEDVLGQARRSSSLRPFKYTLPSPEVTGEGENAPTLPKSRSISDMGKAGSSKRVVLRGLR